MQRGAAKDRSGAVRISVHKLRVEGRSRGGKGGVGDRHTEGRLVDLENTGVRSAVVVRVPKAARQPTERRCGVASARHLYDGEGGNADAATGPVATHAAAPPQP